MFTQEQRLELLYNEVGKKYPWLTTPQDGRKTPVMTKACLTYILARDQQLRTQDLRTSKRMVIPGWGTFSIKRRGERKGHNLHTGEPMVIPPADVVSFKASKTLKTLINGNTERLRKAATARQSAGATRTQAATQDAPARTRGRRARTA
jgi:Bacterial DNA-binding protein